MYNSETLCVEESMHVKFDDKEPGNETPEKDESFVDIQDSEDTLEPDQIDESEVSPEAIPILEAQEEVASEAILHILRIKSLETKKVLEEQCHISD